MWLAGKIKSLVYRATGILIVRPAKPPPPEPKALILNYSPRGSFAEAAHEAGLGYGSPEIAASARAKPGPIETILLPPFMGPLFASIAIAATEQKSPLRVLDFGGALGEMRYFVAGAFGERIALDWNVVETDAYVQKARQLELKEPRFFASIDEAAKSGPFDFVLFSGVLQYVDTWREPLEHPVVRKTKHILISRVPVSDREIPFLQTVETQSYKVSYPGRVMDEAALNRSMQATHQRALAWDLDHHMGELGVLKAPAVLWSRRP